MRDIQWTKSLNEIFQRNFDQYNGLSWQYFGTVQGVHRQFPGIIVLINREEKKSRSRTEFYNKRQYKISHFQFAFTKFLTFQYVVFPPAAPVETSTTPKWTGLF